MADLGIPQNTIAILQKYNYNFQKKFGQNFLIDTHVLEKIVAAAEITQDDLVIEIGPGIGVLTAELAKIARTVTAVELDPRLLPILDETLSSYDNVRVINADAMTLDFASAVTDHFSGEPAVVCANLPYYITSPIIQNLLQNPYISEMTLMVQKEVAERIVAVPGNKDFGVLTLACNYFADTEMIMIVSKECFFPKPKVDSAVVHFKKHSVVVTQNKSFSRGSQQRVGATLCDPASVGASYASPLDETYEKLFKLIKASFAQRRKKLLNSLTNAGYDKDKLSSAFSKLNFGENVRAENLSLDDYKNLLSNLSN